ncbi:MAG: type I-G CRISPR-associated protein Csb2 [Methanothrix sp.]
MTRVKNGSIEKIDSLPAWKKVIEEIRKHAICGLDMHTSGPDALTSEVRQISLSTTNDHRRGEQGEITHVIVYAHMGFGPREQAALQGLERVWGPDGPGVELALQGLGQSEDFAGKSSLLAKSRSWVSRTPFLPTRHPKRTRAGVAKRDGTGLQMGSPEHDLLRLLEQAGLPRPMMVEKVAGTMLGGREMRWESFQCRRREGGGRRAGESSGFRILFPEAVQGPVAVGAANHFGMGGFVGDGLKCIDL